MGCMTGGPGQKGTVYALLKRTKDLKSCIGAELDLSSPEFFRTIPIVLKHVSRFGREE